MMIIVGMREVNSLVSPHVFTEYFSRNYYSRVVGPSIIKLD